MTHFLKITIISLCSFFLTHNKISAQIKGSLKSNQLKDLINPTFLKLTADVKIIDSQYILIPQLKVLEEGKTVQIHKSLYPDVGNSPIADIQITVEKLVRCVFQNIYVPAFRDPDFDQEHFLFKNYKSADFLTDSINLDPYFALDPGQYRIAITLKFYSKGKQGMISSEWTSFDVIFNPKNSMWGNCK